MLTARRQRFVAEYVVDFNAAQAAIRAGYSPRAANSAGARLMREPDVTAAVERAVRAQERRIVLNADRVVLELVRVAFSDIRAFLTLAPNGTLAPRPQAELSPDHTAAIAQIAPAAKGRRAVIRLHDKKHALSALARHVGLWERRAFVDPKMLNAEGAALRQRLFAAAGLPAPSEAGA